MVDIIAVDTDIACNAPQVVSTVNSCRAATVGSSFQIDVIVKEIPPAGAGFNGISGAEFGLLYDASVLSVTGRAGGTDVMFFQGAPVGSYFAGFSDPLPDSDGMYLVSGTELGGTPEYGPGVLARVTIEVVGVGTSEISFADPYEGDGVPNILDFIGTNYPINHQYVGEIRADGTPCPGDSDGDGVLDDVDNCSDWPNPSQTLPPWSTQMSGDIDTDCDGFGEARETAIGTAGRVHCSLTTTPNDEAIDAWPPDFNDSQSVNLSDVILMGPSYNRSQGQAGYNPRFDLNANGSVNLSDVILMGPFYNKSCTP